MMHAIITQREEIGQHGGLMDCLEREYISFFETLDFTCFPMSNYVEDVANFFDSVSPDLVVLTGGGIIQESGYRYCVSGRHQHHRDAREESLIRISLQKGIPIVGICRGMHKLNSYFGGMVEEYPENAIPRIIGEMHTVHCVDGRNLIVNHFHRDGIQQTGLAPAMKAIAFDASNGCIEAYVGKRAPVLGMQWHPERLDVTAEGRIWAAKAITNLVARQKQIPEIAGTA